MMYSFWLVGWLVDWFDLWDFNVCMLYNAKGARGVMAIVVGNGHGNTSSNP